MSTFESQIEAAEKRHIERTVVRAANKRLISSGEPFKADTPERVHLWFRRRGLSPDLAERAIKSGDVPLEAQESFRPVGRDEPLGLERVLGTTDFLGVAFLERGLQVAKTVGRVSIRGRTGSPAGFGTGFMVGPRLMMTNNHVLESSSQSADSLVEFDYFVRSDGTPSTIKAFTLRPDLFFRTDPRLDFTLVAVSEVGANGAQLSAQGWNQLIPDEGKAIIGQWVNIIQHPNGEPKQLVLRNNEIVDTPDQFLTYVADTAPGSSGSPVLNDQWEVVALHHAGKPARDKAGNILNLQAKPWKPWMGEHQVKWESNEGARISRIVAHVNSLSLSASERALFQAALQPVHTPLAPSESGRIPSGTTDLSSPVVSPDGTATWTIPLRVSLSLGGLVTPGSVGLQAPAPHPLPPASSSGSAAVGINDEKELLEKAKGEFLKRPDVLGVRLGYRFVDGWITRERAIVVTVAEKMSQFELSRSGRSALPTSFAGYPVQLTGPTLRELVGASGARTTEFFETADALRLEEILYKAPDVALTTFNERMRLNLHLSPDAGWPSLEEFIQGTEQRLVIGMYDFGATHIRDAILTLPKLKELVLVMQNGESLGSGTKKDDIPDAEIAQSLSDKFGDRFHFGWVKIGPKNGWVARSYHIKVAVRDSKAFWLSSGNWQSSNQPPHDLRGSTDLSFLDTHNREWNAIVHHRGLAEIFEAHLRNDLTNGSTPDFVEALAKFPNIAVPMLEARRGPRPSVKYFDPLEIDEKVQVTPLLTPDNYFEAMLALVKSAKREILLQNQTFNAPGPQHEKLAELLGAIQEKQRHIPVRIVFRLFMESNARQNLEALMDMGFDMDMVRVQKGLHTKGMVVDGRHVLLGSQNISESGISINRDASLLFEHEGIAKYFQAVFEHDWENLAQRQVGNSVQRVRLTEAASLEDAEWELLSPKDYLPLL